MPGAVGHAGPGDQNPAHWVILRGDLARRSVKCLLALPLGRPTMTN